VIAGAERAWTALEGAAIRVPPVAWIHGDAAPADRDHLAARMARRIVALRARPRVLVARPVGQAEATIEALEAAGLESVHVPAIEIHPAPTGGAFDTAVAKVVPGDIVVVTSANAARVMLQAAWRLEVDPKLLGWAAVGEATSAVLVDAGLTEVFVASEPTGAALARELPLRPGDRVLVPHADIADRALAETLRDRGATVTDVIAYETIEAPGTSRPLLAAALDDGPLDVLVLTSGSTARGLLALATEDDRARLLATPVITGGPTTFAVARELGFDTVLQAPSPGARALATFTAGALGVNAPRPDPAPTTTGETR
jgi:uroporphyrinogen-III synthase